MFAEGGRFIASDVRSNSVSRRRSSFREQLRDLAARITEGRTRLEADEAPADSRPSVAMTVSQIATSFFAVAACSAAMTPGSAFQDWWASLFACLGTVVTLVATLRLLHGDPARSKVIDRQVSSCAVLPARPTRHSFTGSVNPIVTTLQDIVDRHSTDEVRPRHTRFASASASPPPHSSPQRTRDELRRVIPMVEGLMGFHSPTPGSPTATQATTRSVNSEDSDSRMGMEPGARADPQTALWFNQVLSDNQRFSPEIEPVTGKIPLSTGMHQHINQHLLVVQRRESETDNRNPPHEMADSVAVAVTASPDMQPVSPVSPVTEASRGPKGLLTAGPSYRHRKSLVARREHVLANLDAMKSKEGDEATNALDLKMGQIRSAHTKQFADEAVSGGEAPSHLKLPAPVHPDLPLGSNVTLDQFLESEPFGSWNLDVFALDDVTQGHAFWTLGMMSLESNNLIPILDLDSDLICEFLVRAERSYCLDASSPNQYHNSVHGADVCNSVQHFCLKPMLAQNIDVLSALSLVVAALMHDYRHPGSANGFLVATNDELAVTYNDLSVLENWHAAETFRLLAQEECNFTKALTEAQYRRFRTTVVKLIMATDLSQQFEYVSKFNKLNLRGPDFQEEKNRVLLMQMALKAADVSHPAKPWQLHARWTNAIQEEFFAVGDMERERGMKVGPLGNRETIKIPQAQVDFINYVARPCIKVWATACEDDVWLSMLEANYGSWSRKIRRRSSV